MPDALVEAAIRSWAPRFVAQGVDYNDFVRTTAKIEVWDEWIDRWAELGDHHVRLSCEAEEKGRRRTAPDLLLRASSGGVYRISHEWGGYPRMLYDKMMQALGATDEDDAHRKADMFDPEPAFAT